MIKILYVEDKKEFFCKLKQNFNNKYLIDR